MATKKEPPPTPLPPLKDEDTVLVDFHQKSIIDAVETLDITVGIIRSIQFGTPVPEEEIIKALAVLAKLGFKIEGTLKDSGETVPLFLSKVVDKL